MRPSDGAIGRPVPREVVTDGFPEMRRTTVAHEPREEEARQVRTVSEVTGLVKSVLETSLPSLWVEGEISNFKHHSSGHMYFTLKDDSSALPSLMFRFANEKLAFKPGNGMRVVAQGRIKVYEPQGRYQLYVERMRPSGIGALAQAFEELKKRLAEEGLFDPERRKPLPEFPRTVAVVTSPTGAAVRDVIRVIRARAPMTDIVVVPTVVQGADAAPSIADAIRAIDAWGGADVAIVGRGGGSLEDLWAFNEEEVARAVAGSRTPIVSAVGHEIDYTICDFVADARAATPSNAGEIVSPDREDLRRSVAASMDRARLSLERWVESRSERVGVCLSGYGMRAPAQLVARFSERVDELTERLGGTTLQRLEVLRARLERGLSELRLADPSGILARGFASVGLLPELAPVRSTGDVEHGSQVRVRVSDGTFDCVVESVAPESKGTARSTRRRGRSGS